MKKFKAPMGRQVAVVLCLLLLMVGAVGLAQEATSSPSAQQQQTLGPWATAAFVWVILVLAMAFVIGMGWLSRSRR